MKFFGGDEHFEVVLATLAEGGEGFIEGDFVLLADGGEGVGGLVGARLATADVEGGEKGSPSAGVASEDRFHGEGRVEVVSHGPH